MRTRTELVTELVEQATPEASTIEELRAFGWDSQAVLVTVTKSHVLHVLDAFESGAINSSQVRDWAKRLEYRDDVGYEDGGEGVVNEAIFWLAVPAINGALDASMCRRIEALFASR